MRGRDARNGEKEKKQGENQGPKMIWKDRPEKDRGIGEMYMKRCDDLEILTMESRGQQV